MLLGLTIHHFHLILNVNTFSPCNYHGIKCFSFLPLLITIFFFIILSSFFFLFPSVALVLLFFTLYFLFVVPFQSSNRAFPYSFLVVVSHIYSMSLPVSLVVCSFPGRHLFCSSYIIIRKIQSGSFSYLQFIHRTSFRTNFVSIISDFLLSSILLIGDEMTILRDMQESSSSCVHPSIHTEGRQILGRTNQSIRTI